MVSMPCVERFALQEPEHREKVLPPEVTARVVVEAGVSAPWYQYAGCKGRVLGIDRFGESAPGKELFDYFGLTKTNIQKTVAALLSDT